MDRTQRSRLAFEVALVVAVAILAVAQFTAAAKVTPYHGDETDYLITSAYFEFLFVDRDLRRPEWGDNYWTHTQPMLARYIVGGWLYLRGNNHEDLPRQRYRFFRSYEQNVADGAVPGESLLQLARQPMPWFAAAVTLGAYGLARLLAGRAAGLIAAALLPVGPAVVEAFTRALPEAPWMAFQLAAFLAIAGMLHARPGRPLTGSVAILAGICMGLSLAAKLTATLGIAAFSTWGGLVAAATMLQGPGPERRRVGAGLAVLGSWMIALLAAAMVFVASNPHLYANPLAHTYHLYDQRREEMRQQERSAPENVLPSLTARVDFGFEHGFPFGAPAGGYPGPLVVGARLLALFGFAWLVAASWRSRHATRFADLPSLMVVTVIAYMVGTFAGLSLTYERYLVPPYVLVAILIGCGSSAAGRGLAAFAPRVTRSRRPRSAAA